MEEPLRSLPIGNLQIVNAAEPQLPRGAEELLGTVFECVNCGDAVWPFPKRLRGERIVFLQDSVDARPAALVLSERASSGSAGKQAHDFPRRMRLDFRSGQIVAAASYGGRQKRRDLVLVRPAERRHVPI